jgi:hypothetical protein
MRSVSKFEQDCCGGGGFKGTVQRDFNFFFTYIDRDRAEYEPLILLKFFRGPHDFGSKNIFLTRFRRNPFGKTIY